MRRKNGKKSECAGLSVYAFFAAKNSYTEMLTEARHKAISRMVEEALLLNADAVVNLRFTTSAIMSNASEILAYGTAVRLNR